MRAFITAGIGAVLVVVAASLVDIRLGIGVLGVFALIVGLFGDFE